MSAAIMATNSVRLAIAFTALVLSGCGTAITVRSGEMPDAQVEPLPLNAAVRFDESITGFAYEEKLATGGTYAINLDDSSAEMLESTLTDLFQNVTIVGPDTEAPDADLLIAPKLIALEFVVPSQTISSDYAIWLKYQIQVFDSNGNLQADYLIPAYGKAPKDSFMGGAKEALSIAANRALRDAATVLLTRFVVDAKLQGRQLRQPQRIADQPVTTPPPDPSAVDTPAETLPSPDSDLTEQYL